MREISPKQADLLEQKLDLGGEYNPKDKLYDLFGAIQDKYTEKTAWHFEERDKLNRPQPNSEKEAIQNGYKYIPAPRDGLHQDKVGKPERKFVHDDGREVIFDGDTGKVVTDPRYKGTYNYDNDGPWPDFSDPRKVQEWMEWAKDGAPHFVYDMMPYFIAGNKRGKD